LMTWRALSISTYLVVLLAVDVLLALALLTLGGGGGIGCCGGGLVIWMDG